MQLYIYIYVCMCILLLSMNYVYIFIYIYENEPQFFKELLCVSLFGDLYFSLVAMDNVLLHFLCRWVFNLGTELVKFATWMDDPAWATNYLSPYWSIYLIIYYSSIYKHL